MKSYVVPLDGSLPGRSEVGGKAVGLAAPAAAGFPVPSALCITVQAFHLALGPYSAAIKRASRESADGSDDASQEIQAILADLQVPEPVLMGLRDQADWIGGLMHPLVVRSSALEEDRADVSFAGQYDSFLGVSEEEAVLHAIVSCWRSFFSTHAAAARAALGGEPSSDGMAVLVQTLVEAECAGVCYSVDPVAPVSGRLAINAVWGMGAGVADGSVAADTIWVDRETLRVARRDIVEKSERIALSPMGGTARFPVALDARRAGCLPDAWAERVAQFAVALEQLLGGPQDMEWAIADGRIFVLQSRPLTGLPRALAHALDFPLDWPAESDQRLSWRRARASTGRVTLPLENDYLDAQYGGGDDGTHFNGDPTPTRLGYFNGRRYYTDLAADLHAGDRRIRRNALNHLNRRLLQEEGKTAWDYWGPEVIAATEHLRAFQRDDAGPSEIADHFEDALGTVRRSWMIHMLLGEPPLELYVEAFARVAEIEPAQAAGPANGLIFGQDTVLTRLIDRLYELAVEARPFPAVRALVSDPPPAVLERLSALPEAASFLERLGSLLNDYGERTGNGMFSTATVLTSTWRERPDLLLRNVSGYLDPVVQPPDVARQLARHARDIYLDELCAASPDADAVPELRRQLALALRDATVLEEHNHYIDQMSLGQFRAAALRAGDALTDRGTISQREDAFWLRSVEIVEALRSDIAPSHTGLVQERRASHDRWSALTPPAILGLPSSLLDSRPPLTDEVTPSSAPIAGRLQGKPGSGGQRTGRARVVVTDTEVPRVASGDILVAENASPQWTPLFPVLGGLVLDGGVMGEHALATAREYGIPAVISTGTATVHIAEGQAITVDGSAGVVHLDATD